MKKFSARFTYSMALAMLFTLSTLQVAAQKIPVIFDTDANNELDDQHALAYLLFSRDIFDIRGITINATRNGGPVTEQYEEAKRVVYLCGQQGKQKIIIGANQNYKDLKDSLLTDNYVGRHAVNFIIDEAMRIRQQKLNVVAVGKLTNVALAIERQPIVADRIRLIWLGSNYPAAGEYNLVNDTAALNYVLKTNVEMEIVPVRPNDTTGTRHVRVLQREIEARMPCLGPIQQTGIEGRRRDGKLFTNFGDYSVDLFKHIRYSTTPPDRALFDLVPLSLLRQPAWGQRTRVTNPVYTAEGFKTDTTNVPTREVIVWENFNRNAIIEDFFRVMGLAGKK